MLSGVDMDTRPWQRDVLAAVRDTCIARRARTKHTSRPETQLEQVGRAVGLLVQADARQLRVLPPRREEGINHGNAMLSGISSVRKWRTTSSSSLLMPPPNARHWLGMVRIAAYRRDRVRVSSLKMWVSEPTEQTTDFAIRAILPKGRV